MEVRIMQTAATMTMNSPKSLTALHELASADGGLETAVANAELMREVGLKCIGFNGVSQCRWLKICCFLDLLTAVL
jgi:hypothetical protein